MTPEPPPDPSSSDPWGILAGVEKGADKAITSASAGWWANADENQRLAVWALAAAAAIGPLGQGFAGLVEVLYDGAAVPGAKQVAAVFWLLVITLPVAAGAAVLVLGAGRMAGGALLILAGAAAYFGGAFLASLGALQPLGDFYCSARVSGGEIVYATQCEAYDQAGFVAQAGGLPGSPAAGAEALRWAFVYTSDVRGVVMTLAGAVAATAAAYLVRREGE